MLCLGPQYENFQRAAQSRGTGQQILFCTPVSSAWRPLFTSKGRHDPAPIRVPHKHVPHRTTQWYYVVLYALDSLIYFGVKFVLFVICVLGENQNLICFDVMQVQ